MSEEGATGLRDYSADARILYSGALAPVLGAVSALAVWALLEMIALLYKPVLLPSLECAGG